MPLYPRHRMSSAEFVTTAPPDATHGIAADSRMTAQTEIILMDIWLLFISPAIVAHRYGVVPRKMDFLHPPLNRGVPEVLYVWYNALL